MISVIVPVYNEEGVVAGVLKDLACALDGLAKEYEIIVVNDGSIDNSQEIVSKLGLKNLKIIDHPENLGYGKSLFDGILESKYECIAIIDSDGSYSAGSLKDLYCYYPKYDMVVGARQGKEYARGFFKRPARMLFEYLARYATGRKIPDVNSGIRIFKKSMVMGFQDSLCTGFSFTTTLTLLFLLNHFYVKYVPIEYLKRSGKSKVKHFKDTLRAAQIIVQAILYYNPIKLFLLIAALNSILAIMICIINYLFFKSFVLAWVSAICIASFVPLFCLGLISDQLKKIYNLSKEQRR